MALETGRWFIGAIKAFELLQGLIERWANVDCAPKRTIGGIMLESIRLNSGNVEFPQENLSICCGTKKFVPPTGASRTPIELFLGSIREIDQKTQFGITTLAAIRTGPASAPA